MQPEPGDPSSVTAAIDMPGFDLDAVLSSEDMSIAQLERLAADIAKYKSYGFRDTSIRSYANHFPAMISLKDLR